MGIGSSVILKPFLGFKQEVMLLNMVAGLGQLELEVGRVAVTSSDRTHPVIALTTGFMSRSHPAQAARSELSRQRLAGSIRFLTNGS